LALEVRSAEPLAPRTTLGVGGPARFFAEVSDLAALNEARAFARAERVELFVLGGGSNLLVSDRGLDALVVRLAIRGFEVERDERGALLTVGAGETWGAVVARAVGEGWAGLECLGGIPGDTGATPIQNVGAYGQEVSETIVEVVALDLASGELVRLPAAACDFEYRSSAFKHALRGRYVVTGVRFRLVPDGRPSVRYPELEKALGGGAATLAEVHDAVLALRRKKSMVLDPADENTRSAGSFFTNPIVGARVADAARALALAMGHEGMPEYEAPAGKKKLSAAWLIERAGFARGTARGRAGISSKHSLAIVNRGGATAQEIVALAAEIQAGVLERFGVRITPEPELRGFSAGELAGLILGEPAS
jgi:UDP-N-acetylmuramate dehydrogenase